MDDEKVLNERECCKPRLFIMVGLPVRSMVLFIGACVYFIGSAATFGLGVLGFLKALGWPAFLVYAALKYLGL